MKAPPPPKALGGPPNSQHASAIRRAIHAEHASSAPTRRRAPRCATRPRAPSSNARPPTERPLASEEALRSRPSRRPGVPQRDTYGEVRFHAAAPSNRTFEHDPEHAYPAHPPSSKHGASQAPAHGFVPLRRPIGCGAGCRGKGEVTIHHSELSWVGHRFPFGYISTSLQAEATRQACLLRPRGRRRRARASDKPPCSSPRRKPDRGHGRATSPWSSLRDHLVVARLDPATNATHHPSATPRAW